MGTEKQRRISVLDFKEDTSLQENPKSKKEKKTKKNCCKEEKEDITSDVRTLVDLGLDISTSIVGIAILNSETRKMVNITYCKLNRTKFKDIWDKSAEVKSVLSKVIDNKKYKVRHIFVEEAHMRFTPGFSSAKTLFLLSRFNGIVSYVGYEMFDVKPIMINVRTGRKNLGIKINRKDKSKDNKTKIFEVVKKMHPDFPWVQHLAKSGKHKGSMVYDKCNFDMADAWITAAAGQVEYPFTGKSG